MKNIRYKIIILTKQRTIDVLIQCNLVSQINIIYYDTKETNQKLFIISLIIKLLLLVYFTLRYKDENYCLSSSYA